jgi:hypothetical protein
MPTKGKTEELRGWLIDGLGVLPVWTEDFLGCSMDLTIW